MSVIKFTIPIPCHENWQNMTSIEKGRFCPSCQKDVVDFSDMSDTEAYRILLKGNANMCGRFSTDQIKKGIDHTVEKRYWHKYFFSFLVPAVLFTKQSSAQMGIIAKAKVAKCPVGMNKMIVAFADKSYELSGRVVDSVTNEIIGYGTLSVKGTGNEVVINDSGVFTLKGKVNGPCVTVRITSIGYEPKEMEISIPASDFVIGPETFYLKKQVIRLDDVIVHSESGYLGRVAGGYSMSVKINRFRDFPRRLITAISDSIKIYPGPVKRGSTFKIALKLKRTGSHTIQIIDPVGSIVFQQSINMIAKEYIGQINCSPAWSAGVYSVRIITPGKMMSASRFVVE